MIAFHVKVSAALPAVTDETTGGTDLGVTLAETVEYELVPTELTAATLKKYGVLFVNPVTVADVEVEVPSLNVE